MSAELAVGAEYSVAQRAVARLVKDLGPDGARQAIRALCAKFTQLELAALAANWPTWARPKQLPPLGEWRSWGLLAGRGFGKTRSIGEHINAEVQANRIGSLGLAAQNEDKSIEIHIEGPTGLIKTAPPWFRPTWEAVHKQLVWPNGARGYVRTPEKPGTIRSGEHHASWLSEIQSWPAAQREEAFLNFEFATRVGYAHILWDATAKRGHPILLALLQAHALEPDRHHIARGSMDENEQNLGKGVARDLKKKYGGTAQGREELDGEMLKEGENPIARQAWIDSCRRHLPSVLIRKGIGIDPAVTSRKGSDRTGIASAALGEDKQAYVRSDKSGRHAPYAWADIALATYVEEDCDIIVVETNKGGDLVVQNLRAAAKDKKLKVVEIGLTERPRGQHGIVYIKQVHSRGEKADRARPLSTAYKNGRISHVIGAELSALETTLTTWEPTPGARSPDDLDAVNLIVTELLELADEGIDPTAGFDGISEMAKALVTPQGGELAALLDSLARRGGGRI